MKKHDVNRNWKANWLRMITKMMPCPRLLGALATASMVLGLATAQASAAIPSETGGGRMDGPVYVAMGASDAVGVGASRPSEGWVPQVHKRLPGGTRLTNLGESGSLLLEAMRRQLPLALALRPQVVTVWLAVNDFNNLVPLAQYSRDLEYTLRALCATGAQVYVGNLPDISLLPGIPNHWRGIIRSEVLQWNDEIRRVAHEQGATVVDLYTERAELLAHPEYLSWDGFHPSAKGYSRIADIFWDAMGRETRAELG